MARPDETNDFRLFLSWLHGRPHFVHDAGVHAVEKDPPDFHLDWAGKRVSVEHTRCFHGSRKGGRGSPQSVMVFHDKVCAAVKAQVKKHIARPLQLDLTLIDADTDIDLLAEQIVEFLIPLSSTIGPTFQRYYRHELPDAIPVALFCILVCSRDTGPVSVTAMQDGCVDEWGLGPIEAAAKAKHSGLQKYHANYDECWLLLGVGGFHRAEWIEPCRKACETGVPSEFDRIFVVDSWEGRVVQLRPKASLDWLTPAMKET